MTNHEVNYYQSVVTDLTSSNERLSEQVKHRTAEVERVRTECHELRTIISLTSLYIAALEGRGMHDPTEVLTDLKHIIKVYTDSKKVTS